MGFHVSRQPNVVIVQERNIWCMSVGETGVTAVTDVVASVPHICRSELSGDFFCLILRIVVDHDDLLRRGDQRRRKDALDRLAEESGPVPCRYYNGDLMPDNVAGSVCSHRLRG
jgi:hypothetical protein